MADRSRPTHLKRLGSTASAPLLGALATGAILVTQLDLAVGENPLQTFGVILFAGLLALPAAIAGALVAMALRPLKDTAYWPFLVACAIAVLGGTAVQLVNTILGPWAGPVIWQLCAFGAICGFLIDISRHRPSSEPSPHEARTANAGTAVRLIWVTLLLGAVVWATNSWFAAGDYHAWGEAGWRERVAWRQWMMHVINGELLLYFALCAALLRQHRKKSRSL